MSGCRLKFGFITGEPYCATHGRHSGWPCSTVAESDQFAERRDAS